MRIVPRQCRGLLLIALSIALLGASCQRTFVYVPTQPGSGPASPAAPERTAVVQEMTGRVEARLSRGADWAAAASGQLLAEGSEVRTGADGMAMILLTEGTRIRIGPNTSFSFSILNPFLDSQLTAIQMGRGEAWILMYGGALDVETPFGIASARAAYLSVQFDASGRSLIVTCLQGTCGFGSVLIPSGYKLVEAQQNTSPEPMTLADFGVWGVRVPEATQLAYAATEALLQGSATLPRVATHTPLPTDTPIPPSPTRRPTSTPTTPPDQPTRTPAPTATRTATKPPSPTLRPSPTLAVVLPTVTRPAITPIPPAPVIGRHTVLSGEHVFCIGRGYGVQPGAIAQANGLVLPYTVFPGQILSIPKVQWVNISAGLACAPQFASPFPGLPVATATAAAQALVVNLSYMCVFNCGSQEGDYIIRFDVQVSGGQPPYSYDPAQNFDLTVPHCTHPSGSIIVTSADGQRQTVSWFFQDVSCPES